MRPSPQVVALGLAAFLNASAAEAPTQVEMKNVDFHVDESIVLHVKTLHGALVTTKRASPVSFDDKRSFLIQIDAGEVGISTSALSDLMNRYVFAYDNAPHKNIQITAEGDRLKQRGTLHKGVDVPFEVEGTLEATPDGLIRLHTKSIHSAHLPVKGLLDLFGVKVARLVNVNEARGVKIEKDDFILYPDRLIPSPQIRGIVRAVRIEGDRIIQTYGDSRDVKPLSPPEPKAANYMYFRGGTLHFGKLTMTDSDLQIVDADPKDPFDFFLDRYNQQLVAGYSKNTPNYGLIVSMPDYAQVAKQDR
jgi:hypothetical protein